MMRSRPGRASSRWPLVLAVAAPVLLVGGLVLAQSRQPEDYDPVAQTASALAGASAADPHVMTGTLVGLGVIYLVLALGSATLSLLGRLLLGVGGAALTVAATVPQPAGGSSAVHMTAAGVAWVAFVAWPMASVSRSGATPNSRGLATVYTALLLMLLVWFCVELWELGTDGERLGLAQRLLLLALTVWPVRVLAATTALSPRSAARRGSSRPPALRGCSTSSGSPRRRSASRRGSA